MKITEAEIFVGTNLLPSPAGGRRAGDEGLCYAKNRDSYATSLTLALSRLREREFVRKFSSNFHLSTEFGV